MMTTAEQIPFQLILNSGNARSFAMEALQFAKQGKMAEADEAMVKAKEAINEAHHFQTELIQSEARGEKTEISVLFNSRTRSFNECDYSKRISSRVYRSL